MELELTRSIKTHNSTIGDLKIDDQFLCLILEDTDRGLTKDMPLPKIMAAKVKGQTAIPLGRYEIAISFSNKFKKMLPLLLNVPGFDGIRIHPGNSYADTTGCLLPGLKKEIDKVSSSKVAFDLLFKKIAIAMKKEKVFISIKISETPNITESNPPKLFKPKDAQLAGKKGSA